MTQEEKYNFVFKTIIRAHKENGSYQYFKKRCNKNPSSKSMEEFKNRPLRSFIINNVWHPITECKNKFVGVLSLEYYVEKVKASLILLDLYASLKEHFLAYNDQEFNKQITDGIYVEISYIRDQFDGQLRGKAKKIDKSIIDRYFYFVEKFLEKGTEIYEKNIMPVL